MVRRFVGLIFAILLLSSVTAISESMSYAAKDKAKINVISSNTFLDERGYLNIVGFLENTSEESLTVPMMKVKLLNKQREITYELKNDPLIHFMNPGSIAPFKITVMDPSRGKQTTNVKITFDQKVPTQLVNPKQVKLAVENAKFLTDNSGTTRIQGDVRNNGVKATDTFILVVAFMNEKNHILDVKTVTHDKSIATGAEMSFSMEYKGSADKYCLVADSRYYVANPAGMCENTGKRIISKPPKDVTLPESSSSVTIQERSDETGGQSNNSEQSIELAKFRVVDANKAKLRQIYVGQEIQLQSKATNNLDSVQPFTYIAQIKDQEGITVMLESNQGKLSPQKQSRLAVKWFAEEPGKYSIEIFVWKNLDDPSPLTAQPLKTLIEVKNKRA